MTGRDFMLTQQKSASYLFNIQHSKAGRGWGPRGGGMGGHKRRGDPRLQGWSWWGKEANARKNNNNDNT